MPHDTATTVKFTTLGCRLNQAESDSMAEQLSARGIGPARPLDDPDVVVVNTCTVTKEATKASRMAIRRAVKDHPAARVVVAGCYAVSDRSEVEAIPGVDAIIGNDEKEALIEALSGHATLRPLLQLRPPGPAPETPVRVRANLKVQTGCDEWCTFCIIPRTRGSLRSMDEEPLLAEARARAAAGARELVLTGVHLGKYSYDRGGDESALVGLFEKILSIPGIERVRLSSILSRHLTSEVIDFMASEPRMCRYLHVPLQSGDDRILEAMHRPYTRSEFCSAVENAKARLPGLALATDIIVGFPGETDAAFAGTMEVVDRLGFVKLHVFRFSPRPGTPAATMGDTVHPEVKKERSRRLIARGNEIRAGWLAEHLGRPLEVLVEDERVVDGTPVCSGQTSDYIRVWFEGHGLLGSTVTVEATGIRGDGLRAVIA